MKISSYGKDFNAITKELMMSIWKFLVQRGQILFNAIVTKNHHKNKRWLIVVLKKIILGRHGQYCAW